MLNPASRARAARAVVEVGLPGAKVGQVAKRHHVHRATLRAWEKAASSGSDPELAVAVAELREQGDAVWFARLGEAVAKGIQFLERAYAEADPKSPEAIRAVTESLSSLVESEGYHRAVNARIALKARPTGKEAGRAAGGRTSTLQ